MKTVEVKIESDVFEYEGTKYGCSSVLSRDMKSIIREAEESHNGDFYRTYIKESLRPEKVRLFLDNDDVPVFGMVIYLIDYKVDKCSRYACGNYYPIYDNILTPHPYQASICW